MKFNQFIQDIKHKIRETDFSGTIHITQDGETIFANAYGFANRADKIPNRIDTCYGIASGTKLFTALAIGILIDKGLFTLDSKAFELFDHQLNPDQYDPRITVAQLLCHTSGMPDYYDEDLIEDFDDFKLAVPNAELMSPFDYLKVFPDRNMKFKPGERFSYSNGGYIVLSMIVEAQSNMPFQTFVEEHVLWPTGMNHSGFYKMNQLPANTALGYIDTDTGCRTNIFDVPIIGAGDGGLFTSAEDMIRLWSGFLGCHILSPELTAEYLKSHALMDEKQQEHAGYGHFMYKQHDSYIRYIVGCDAGVSFKSVYHERHNVQYTVLSNTTDGAWAMTGFIDSILK